MGYHAAAGPLISLLLALVAFAAIPVTAQPQWQTLAPMLIPRSDFQVIAYNSTFYVHGGCIGNQTVNGNCPAITNRLEAYNSLTNAWTELTASPTPRTQYSAALVGSKIYYVGGRDVYGNVIGTVDVYDVAARSWSTLPDQAGATNRSNAAAFVINSVLYVAGGYDNYYNSLATTITLNTTASPLLFQSTTVPAKPVSAGDCGGVAISGQGYVFAGFSSVPANGFCFPLSTIERYSPVTNSWALLSPSPAMQNRGDPAYAAVGGLLFIMGGEGKLPAADCVNGSDMSVPINNVEYYNPSSNSWTVVDTLPVSRFRFSGNVGGASGQLIYNIGGQAGEVITNSTLNSTDPFVDSGYWPVVDLVEALDVSSIVANQTSNGVSTLSSGWGGLVLAVLAVSVIGMVL